jgi:hypothetical protein
MFPFENSNDLLSIGLIRGTSNHVPYVSEI